MAIILVVGCLLMTAALVLLASVLASHGLVDRLELTTRSRNLAEAAVQEACLTLAHEAQWGTQGDEVVRVTLPGDPSDTQSTGRLSFTGADASTNNLSGTAAVPGWRQQSVPPHCAQLVGVGRCRGVEVRLNVVIRSATFPYAVACEGPFVSSSGTRISASLDPAQKAPVDMACNSAVTDAVQLGPGSWVAGDLRSAGGIVLAADSQVGGQTLPYSGAVTLPEIDLSKYDPSLHGVPYQNLPVNLSQETLVGESRCSTDLTVGGDLHLEGATLYVHGNLTVTGSINGSGLVVVEGDTNVRGSTNLDSSHSAVLLSGGNVYLRGSGADASSFSGLVYSKGSFCAEQVSMVGIFISRGSKPTVLDGCRVVYHPEAAVLRTSNQISLQWSKVLASGSSKGESDDHAPSLNGAQMTWGTAIGQLLTIYQQVSNVRLTTAGDQGILTFTVGKAGSGTSPSSTELFNLNDFLGQGKPLELLSWRENQ